MSDSADDNNTNSAYHEVVCCQEILYREEPARSNDLFPASPEFSAPANPLRTKKKRRHISPLMLISSILITTVATLSIGYLKVSAELTYVSENSAGVLLSALWVTDEKDTAPLTYELIERKTNTVVTTGLVPDQDTVLPFKDLDRSTDYDLRIYNGQMLVRQFLFATSAENIALVLPGVFTTPAPGQATTRPTSPSITSLPAVSSVPLPTTSLSPTPVPIVTAADGTVLTTAEAANSGTHTYQFTGVYYGSYSGDTAGTDTKTMVFQTVSGKKMLGDGTVNYYNYVEENTYFGVISGLAITIKFDLGGYTFHAENALDFDYRLMSPTPAPTYLATDGTVLTAAEAANAGTHMYHTTGEIYGPSGGKIVPSDQPITLVFKTVNGTKMMGDGDKNNYTMVAENRYESSINGIKLTAVVTDTGFSIVAEGAYSFDATLLP